MTMKIFLTIIYFVGWLVTAGFMDAMDWGCRGQRENIMSYVLLGAMWPLSMPTTMAVIAYEPGMWRQRKCEPRAYITDK